MQGFLRLRSNRYDRAREGASVGIVKRSLAAAHPRGVDGPVQAARSAATSGRSAASSGPRDRRRGPTVRCRRARAALERCHLVGAHRRSARVEKTGRGSGRSPAFRAGSASAGVRAHERRLPTPDEPRHWAGRARCSTPCVIGIAIWTGSCRFPPHAACACPRARPPVAMMSLILPIAAVG